ncbi:electron transfer flavoprotein-ubiquinone oxidoreductase [Desulfosarcina ovata]|uniref:Electron transfer flavoprotein-ubiquinone oxidoreductase n=2 Tax=Desulfosarcina ovata TaxID=83564 RepID=A0A5K8AEZ9_9BACT|nr:electron transfer flavoprotein-ubiquinone oxidoreductase [Desulfosarcina ovata]BBO84635.1 electron transfer flavoprotein-ubiquinone oxidoreductase [Desulfosarcina ovata subsp. sediminis]BBO91119.1 electron transfer flavoprotein-ubiquinone oxidoreductase [Desulfosarcina ovata subsp. ovata]
MTTHESIDFDVLFIGGGPANLAGAIRLMQLAAEKGRELEVALIDKGAAIGSHAISGAVMNPVAIAELYPDYRDQGFPVEQMVRGDGFYFLTGQRSFKVPMVPRQMHNTGFPIVSLSRVCRWLGEKAEELGINIFPGFDGKTILMAGDGKTVAGVRTGDKGLDKDGKPKTNFEPGIDLMAKVTVLGEGARGSLTKELAGRLPIRSGRLPELFETGIKEVIQLPEDHFFKESPFNDIHTLGFPLDLNTPGGGFVYEMADNRIALGFLVALGYENPALDIYDTFMRFKGHPLIQKLIRGGKVIEQGARAVSTGGWFSMPQLAVDGALFTGNAAAIHSTPAIKGIHLAMKSGMLAAETIMDAIEAGDAGRRTLAAYGQRLADSWVGEELREGRNFAQALAKKGPAKWIHLAAQHVTGGKGLRDRLPAVDDATTLKPQRSDSLDVEKYDVPKDDPAMVDKLTGVYLSGTLHREDQPSHILIHDQRVCVEKCYPTYGCPCTRFCPGDVYEMERSGDGDGIEGIKLNFTNCLHCKTCDIKDPFRNVTWTCPEGGEGPNYKQA